MTLKIYCDGLYEPRYREDGYSCWAWVAVDSAGNEIAKDGGFLGRGRAQFSNNFAEYVAVGRAVRWLKDHGHEAHVFTDSKLVVEQVSGAWDCNAQHLRPLRDRIRELLRGMQNVTLDWVPREGNKLADAYVNEIYERTRREAA